MAIGVPTYVTLTSSGGTLSVSPWMPVDTFRNPVDVSFSIYGSSTTTPSSGAYIEVTLDDPWGMYPNPYSSPGYPPANVPSSSPFVSVLPSSAFPGTMTGNGSAPLTTFPAAGTIQGPIRAWRLATASTAGTFIATALQGGPR